MDAHANFAYSTVATAPSPATSGTTLTVVSASTFPTPPFNATVWPVATTPTAANAEIVRVTNIAGGVLTILRAQEGSSARAILVGDQIAATITAKTLTDVEALLPSADELAALAGSSGTPGAANKYVTSTDPRLSDTRIPSAASIAAAMFSAPPDALFPELFDYESLRRVSDLETIDRLLAYSALSWTTGWVVSTPAVARSSFTATQIRCLITTASAGTTHAFLGVWNHATQALLAQTADDVTIGTTTAPAIITRNLTAPLAVVKGTKYELGLGAAFSSGSLGYRGANASTTLLGVSPQYGRFATGYTGTAPNPIATTATGYALWICLLP